MPNFPFSVFSNRDSFPFVVISRRMALYRVAAGVCPFGLDQYPLAAIASIISFVFIGSFFSPSTLAAASRQPSLPSDLAGFEALGLRAAFGSFVTSPSAGSLVNVFSMAFAVAPLDFVVFFVFVAVFD